MAKGQGRSDEQHRALPGLFIMRRRGDMMSSFMRIQVSLKCAAAQNKLLQKLVGGLLCCCVWPCTAVTPQASGSLQ
eukprot:809444-Pelagomonas_calceolata.AAC.4